VPCNILATCFMGIFSTLFDNSVCKYYFNQLTIFKFHPRFNVMIFICQLFFIIRCFESEIWNSSSMRQIKGKHFRWVKLRWDFEMQKDKNEFLTFFEYLIEWLFWSFNDLRYVLIVSKLNENLLFVSLSFEENNFLSLSIVKFFLGSTNSKTMTIFTHIWQRNPNIVSFKLSNISRTSSRVITRKIVFIKRKFN
jgi:hypothetical protein